MTTSSSAVLTALLALSNLCTSVAGQGEAFEWHRNLTEARKLAETTKRPLFVVFRCER